MTTRGTLRRVSPARTESAAEQDEHADDETAGGPRSVAGQPAPAKSRRSAGTGRRAAIASATASAKPKTAVKQHRAHLGVHARIERRLHVVEVEEAAGEARPDRAGQVARMQRRNVIRDPERRPRREHERGEPRSERANERRQDREPGDRDRAQRLVDAGSRAGATPSRSRPPGMSEVRSVLGNARLSLPRERTGEIVAGAHDRDGDPGGLEPQQLRLGPGVVST